MNMSRIGYRKLNIYKFQVLEDYKVEIDLTGKNISTPFIELKPSGELTIKKGYAWDGPSGPTIDTKTFMRGSLVHDALYQLMREEHLAQDMREYADDLMKKMCLQDGMFALRAWYTHKAVRLFGESSAKPRDKSDKPKLIWAP